MHEPEPAAETHAERAERHPATLQAAVRKQHGAWFTPMELALPTAMRTLAPLLRERDPSTLRIVDPAVGGGAFLRAALHVLAKAGVAPNAAVHQLHGLDVDAEAAKLACLALCEACADAGVEAATVATHVRAGDGLLELEPGTFDAVLTNPPWETLQAADDAKARVAALRPHFHHQGRGKLFTYRLFVERAFQLLRPGGRLGLIVPASLWFDRDAEPLRRLLLDQCEWQWLFAFENRKKVFAIDHRYQFGVVIATKGRSTTSVQVAFRRTELGDWASETPPHVRYGRDELRALSPSSGAFVEVDEQRDLDLLRHLHKNGLPLLGSHGAFTWRQGDFNMTSDRAHFVPRETAEQNGFRASVDGVWRCAGEADLLPLYQGAMLYDLHPNTGAHAGGTGHGTTWTTPPNIEQLRPVYLVPAQAWRATRLQRSSARIVHRALGNATNERTMIVCLLPDVPCGNSLGVLTPRLHTDKPLRLLAATAAALSSLAFDWALRLRLGGTNLNSFVLADCVIPPLDEATTTELAQLAMQLSAILPTHAGLWHQAAEEGWGATRSPALPADHRRQLTTRIDVLVGRAFQLTADDVAWLTRNCDRTVAQLRRRGHAPSPLRGFWRVDRELEAPQRRPNRWLAAIASCR